MSTSKGSQAEFPGGGLGQRPGGTVVITYCPGVILLVSVGYICNYKLSGGDFHPIQGRTCAIEVSRGCMDESGPCSGGHFSLSRGSCLTFMSSGKKYTIHSSIVYSYKMEWPITCTPHTSSLGMRLYMWLLWQ